MNDSSRDLTQSSQETIGPRRRLPPTRHLAEAWFEAPPASTRRPLGPFRRPLSVVGRVHRRTRSPTPWLR